MSDATVIIQHLASVVVFCCSFVAIFQGRVSPVAVVAWATLCTVLAWALWDYWMRRESQKFASPSLRKAQIHAPSTSPSKSRGTQQRLATIKSAALIYAALLGLSPILKSLTRSTTSDSIWALSTWLLVMNVAFFDYSGGSGTRCVVHCASVSDRTDVISRLPASISTNSAMMASAVLASRLPSTTHVFSLTLFSIEMFGLFPMFRRELFAQSWPGHILLTTMLTMAAWGGAFVTLTGGGRTAFVTGVILGCSLTVLCMGICSWWLIGLQKYKNEIHGPWDPARPVISSLGLS